jgi:hypothetical protein
MGVFSICMPAFHRFVSHAMPLCFGTTINGSTPMHGEAPTRLSSGRRHAKRKSLMPAHMYDTAIVKTVDTHVSSIDAEPREDEMQLMEINQDKSTAKSIESVECGPSESGSCEKTQQRRIVPGGWQCQTVHDFAFKLSINQARSSAIASL